MNAKALIALAVFAAAASGVARANDADGSQYAIKFEGSRTRAEVQAEAATVSATRSTEPAGSRVIQAPKSSADRATVRAATTEAVRLGQISHGEVGRI